MPNCDPNWSCRSGQKRLRISAIFVLVLDVIYTLYAPCNTAICYKYFVAPGRIVCISLIYTKCLALVSRNQKMFQRKCLYFYGIDSGKLCNHFLAIVLHWHNARNMSDP